jgi:4'-phosphopantetheinyl transferase
MLRPSFQPLAASSYLASCRIKDAALVQISRVEESGSKAALSAVLSDYLCCAPDALHFQTELFGRPKLHDPNVEKAFNFNVSGCNSRYLVAISLAGDVGIDVELRRPIGDLDRIASIYFTPAEAEAISRLQGDRKLEAFFDCWTFKEAYTKALGTGLSTPFNTFALPASAWNSADVTSVAIHGRNWTYKRFEPWPGFTATVVVAGRLPSSAFHLKD